MAMTDQPFRAGVLLLPEVTRLDLTGPCGGLVLLRRSAAAALRAAEQGRTA